jgi:ornithine carbamoyltransferase
MTFTGKKRDFLRVSDLSEAEHRALFDRARILKAHRQRRISDRTLEGRTLILVFEKPSTRTRLSFEAAMFQLGGSAISLNASESQLARGETVVDTARVASRYADVIMLRTFGDDRLREFAQAATVPVINGLSDGAHPVQVLADLFTVEERLKTIPGKVVAFVGDGASNMARSWAEATKLFGFHLRIGAPKDYWPAASELSSKGSVQLTEDPVEAVLGADVVATDAWTSMGQEKEAQRRSSVFGRFRVDDELLRHAKETSIVLHCLPAHRGQEITDSVLDGPRSAVFDEAENRLHVQKALLEQLVLGRLQV